MGNIHYVTYLSEIFTSQDLFLNRESQVVNGIKPFPSSSQVIIGIVVVVLFSPCRAWWSVGNGRGKWEWKRWKGKEKSGHCLRASFSMHSPDRAWCWQHNSRATWQLIGGERERGRMEMCLWEGFVCQWALAWTDWKSLSFSLSVIHTLFSSSFLSFFPSCGQFGAEGLEDAVIQKSCLQKLCVPMTPSFVLLCDCQSACVCVSESIQFSFPSVLCIFASDKFYSTFTFMHLADAFIQSELHSGYTFSQYVSMCVPWELNPQYFALLTHCSTAEPQEHTVQYFHRANKYHYFKFATFFSVFYRARLRKCYLK